MYLLVDCGKNGTNEFKDEWIQFGSVQDDSRIGIP